MSSEEVSILHSKIDALSEKIDNILAILQNNDQKGTTTKKTRKSPNKTKQVIIKKGKCTLNLYKDALLIGGKTFDRRDLIKGFGGRWNGEHKGWTLNTDKVDFVKAELSKYFEEMTYSTQTKNTYLIKKEDSDIETSSNHSVGNNLCDIESDSD